MSDYQEANVIPFAGVFKKRTLSVKATLNGCPHKNTEVSFKDNELICLDCKSNLNPYLWIENQAIKLDGFIQEKERLQKQVKHLRARADELFAEVSQLKAEKESLFASVKRAKSKRTSGGAL